MKSTVIKMNNTFYSFMNNLIKPRKDSAKIKTSQQKSPSLKDKAKKKKRNEGGKRTEQPGIVR